MRFAEMTTAREHKQKQSSQGSFGLSDTFGGFQSKGSQAQSQPLNFGSHITEFGETQRNLGNIGSTCSLLIRTRLFSHIHNDGNNPTCSLIAAPHILAPDLPGCSLSVEQVDSNARPPPPHPQARTMLPA